VTKGRLAVSVVCVFNDEQVRRHCLDRSLEAGRLEALDIDYVPVDNRTKTFKTAGQALNFGAAAAKHDYVAFVHQDVYLHSLRALEEAAAAMDGGAFGILGAIGISSDGRLRGRVRDRVVLLGERVDQPTRVDSVDEVLFMVPRQLLSLEPLSEDPELGWHAYAVEYGLRVQSAGLHVGAVDIPLTHNSLTTNLANLDVAHRAVADRYPAALPVRTTCGIVRSDRGRLSDHRLLRGHRWRYRWIRESIASRGLVRTDGVSRRVLGDIRFEIDDLLRANPGASVRIVNVRDAEERTTAFDDELDLIRRGRTVTVASTGFDEALATARQAAAGDESVLVTNVLPDGLGTLAAALPPQRIVVGWADAIGCWVLVGNAAGSLPKRWERPPVRPLTLPAAPWRSR
jgi:hypothetical protein